MKENWQEDELMTVEDVAAILQIKRNTIHSKVWQEKSGCPVFKLGRRLYAVRGTFKKWIGGKNVADRQ